MIGDGIHTIPDLDRAGLRKFGLTTGAIVVALFGLGFPWLFEHRFPLWPWAVFGVLGIFALTAPQALRWIYGVWMRFGLILSKITTPIVIGVIFLVVMVPIACIMRIARKDPMNRALSDGKSYRVESQSIRGDSLEHPY